MPQALHRLGVREKRDKGEKDRTAATGEYIMEENKSDFSWKTLLSVGGAWAFITPLIPMVFIFIYAVGTFRSGMLQSFENPSDAYAW